MPTLSRCSGLWEKSRQKAVPSRNFHFRGKGGNFAVMTGRRGSDSVAGHERGSRCVVVRRAAVVGRTSLGLYPPFNRLRRVHSLRHFPLHRLAWVSHVGGARVISITDRAREAPEPTRQDRAPSLWWQSRGFEPLICPGWGPLSSHHTTCMPAEAGTQMQGARPTAAFCWQQGMMESRIDLSGLE